MQKRISLYLVCICFFAHTVHAAGIINAAQSCLRAMHPGRVIRRIGTGVAQNLEESVISLPDKCINAAIGIITTKIIIGLTPPDLMQLVKNVNHRFQKVAIAEADYERLKAHRGKEAQSTIAEEHQFIESLTISDQEKKTLKERLAKIHTMTVNGTPTAEGDLESIKIIKTLPWGKLTQDNLDIKNVEATLNQELFGMEQVKQKILDYIAVQKLTQKAPPPVICLVGPPGVGKTSIAEAIAKALGRYHERIACGAIQDTTILTGFPRTYIGAQPGAFIKALQRAGSMNPVITLDEIDKIGNNYRSDPTGVFLEMFNPNQSKTFRDHFVDVPFDFSKVLFIATANDLENIPRAVRDRIKIMHIDRYTLNEKIAIAQNHVLKKVIEQTGLQDQNVQFSDELLKHIITTYTHEAGVRDLERILTTLCSKMARTLVEHGQLPILDIHTVHNFIAPQTHLPK